MKTIGISGHRPPRLGLDYSEKSENLLKEFFVRKFDYYFKKNNSFPILNCGMALGSDCCAAWAFLELGLEYRAFIPFKGMESKWPFESQKKWHRLLDKALEVRYISKEGYSAKKFIERDKAVVNASDLMVFLLDDKPEKSGTRHTFDYCIKQGIKYINLWPEFIGEI